MSRDRRILVGVGELGRACDFNAVLRDVERRLSRRRIHGAIELDLDESGGRNIRSG